MESDSDGRSAKRSDKRKEQIVGQKDFSSFVVDFADLSGLLLDMLSGSNKLLGSISSFVFDNQYTSVRVV
jgi:hypothetical protein